MKKILFFLAILAGSLSATSQVFVNKTEVKDYTIAKIVPNSTRAITPDVMKKILLGLWDFNVDSLWLDGPNIKYRRGTLIFTVPFITGFSIVDTTLLHRGQTENVWGSKNFLQYTTGLAPGLSDSSTKFINTAWLKQYLAAHGGTETDPVWTAASTNYYTKGEANALFVPLSRQLTINGVTHDLSINRSWTVSLSEVDPKRTTAIQFVGNDSIHTLVLTKADGSTLSTSFFDRGSGGGTGGGGSTDTAFILSQISDSLAAHAETDPYSVHTADSANMLLPYFREVGYALQKSSQIVSFDSLSSAVGFHTRPYNDQRYYSASNPSGFISANQTISFAPTGDVTGSTTGTTTLAPTLAIGTNKVTNSMLAQVATATFKGRTTSGTGNVEDLTVSQAKTLLGLSGTNSGDQNFQSVLDAGNTSTTLAKYVGNYHASFTQFTLIDKLYGDSVVKKSKDSVVALLSAWNLQKVLDAGNSSTTGLLVLDNNIASVNTGTGAQAGLFNGILTVQNTSSWQGAIKGDSLTAHRIYQLPNAAGTLALRSDITAETDATALAKTITATQGSGILIIGTATQALSVNPSWIFKADSSLLSTKWYVDNSLAGYLQKSDSSIYYTKYRSDTSRANIFSAIAGKQNLVTLTTTGSSGAATFNQGTGALNIPNYGSAGMAWNGKYIAATSGDLNATTLSVTNPELIHTGGTATTTLPLLTAGAGGEVVHFLNVGTGNLTVQRNGSDGIFYHGAVVTSFVLAPGQSCAFQAVHGYWTIFFDGYNPAYLTSYTETDPLALKIASNLSDLANAGTARTNLGATTVGGNIFTLSNPGAISFLRINADNSVTARSAANFKTDLSLDLVENAAASGLYVPLTRTVNSKALSSNITLGLASADFANQGTTTTVLHGNASGNPSFGAIVNADITNSTITSAKLVGTDITTVGTITSGGLGTGAVIGGVTMTLGSDAAWDLYARDGSGILHRIPAGADGKVLTTHSTTSIPTWETSSGSVSTTDHDLTVSGSVVNTNKTSVNLTGSSTPTWNRNNGFAAIDTLSANTTLTISNAVTNDFGSLLVVQNGTGGYTITVPNGTVTLDGAAGAKTLLTYYYDGSTYYWHDGAISSGATAQSLSPSSGLSGSNFNGSAAVSWTNDVLTGKAGGQTWYGGTAANEDVTIRGTSHATKTTSYVLLQDNGGNVGIGQTAPLARLHIGDYNTNPSTDAQLLIARNVDNNVAGNGHAFSDGSLINRSGVIGYNSYDARSSITGTYKYDHHAGFQSGLTYGSTDTIYNIYGLIDITTVNSGIVSNRMGADVWDIGGSGGTIINNYGIHIQSLTRGTNNWALYTEGSTKSYFGGNVGIGISSPDSALSVLNGFWAQRGVRLSGLSNAAGVTSDSVLVVSSTGVVKKRDAASFGGAGSGDMILASIQTVTGAKTFNDGKLILAGATSGTTILKANATAGSGTVTLPTSGILLSDAAAVTVAQGGTGTTSLTAHDIIIGNGASAVNVLAPSSSGKIVISNGTDFVMSTPTYPNSAGSSGNILQSDGTNWTSTAPVTSFNGQGSDFNIASTSYVTVGTKTLTVAAGDVYFFEYWGEILNNSAATKTYTLSINVGSLAIECTNGGTTAASGTNKALVHITGAITIISTSSARGDMELHLSTGVAAGATGDANTNANFRQAFQTTSSDITGSQNITVAVKSSATTTTQTMTTVGFKLIKGS